jgi:hypothetical protein
MMFERSSRFAIVQIITNSHPHSELKEAGLLPPLDSGEATGTGKHTKKAPYPVSEASELIASSRNPVHYKHNVSGE